MLAPGFVEPSKVLERIGEVASARTTRYAMVTPRHNACRRTSIFTSSLLQMCIGQLIRLRSSVSPTHACGPVTV